MTNTFSVDDFKRFLFNGSIPVNKQSLSDFIDRHISVYDKDKVAIIILPTDLEHLNRQRFDQLIDRVCSDNIIASQLATQTLMRIVVELRTFHIAINQFHQKGFTVANGDAFRQLYVDIAGNWGTSLTDAVLERIKTKIVEQDNDTNVAIPAKIQAQVRQFVDALADDTIVIFEMRCVDGRCAIQLKADGHKKLRLAVPTDVFIAIYQKLFSADGSILGEDLREILKNQQQIGAGTRVTAVQVRQAFVLDDESHTDDDDDDLANDVDVIVGEAKQDKLAEHDSDSDVNDGDIVLNGEADLNKLQNDLIDAFKNGISSATQLFKITREDATWLLYLAKLGNTPLRLISSTPTKLNGAKFTFETPEKHKVVTAELPVKIAQSIREFYVDHDSVTATDLLGIMLSEKLAQRWVRILHHKRHVDREMVTVIPDEKPVKSEANEKSQSDGDDSPILAVDDTLDKARKHESNSHKTLDNVVEDNPHDLMVDLQLKEMNRLMQRLIKSNDGHHQKQHKRELLRMQRLLKCLKKAGSNDAK